ncbi:hypothetical protein [Gilliamella sp. BG1]|uniref:DUF7716 domain-containing protein n=1 Tax=Gilliamella sp. BG1 TaxID=3351508 RepID=UPI0039874A13
MKTLRGIDNLFRIYKNLNEPWSFFVEPEFINEINCIKNANYYIAETEDEFDEMDDSPDKYDAWLEYPTFQAIIDNKLEHHPNATKKDLLDAIIYYLENDDFFD